MKKVILSTCIVLFTLHLFAAAASAATAGALFRPGEYNYILNDQKLSMDVAPFTEDGRIYIPVRFLAHSLGMADKTISWDKSTGTVSLIYQGDSNMEIKVQTGQRQLVINYLDDEALKVIGSENSQMDVAPLIKKGRVFLPARWVAQACGFSVQWDKTTDSVLVKPSGEDINTDDIQVSTREIKSTSEKMELDLKIPVISGLKNIALQEKVNKQILDAAMQTKMELENTYREYAQSAKDNDFEPHPFQLHVNYEVHTSGKVLSLAVQTYRYSGGAHGMAWKDFYILDTQKGKRLTLQNLFKNKTNYKALINQEIKRQINAGEKMYFEGDMGFQTISDNHPFYVQDNNIVFFFGQYEIAPYAAGMPEFKIPVDILKDELSDYFLDLIND
ncbi:MAG: DUF3298 domain-containing protein [Firmicutes bacterium]|nr:DUF3298 domain-containing protein [Bacillota bacterium]